MMIRANGSEQATMIDCSPDSAFSPPASSRKMAIRPSAAPHTMVTGLVGTARPDWDIDPITTVAESAAVTKKITTAMITTMAVSPESGRLSMMSNITFSPDPSIPRSTPSRFSLIAVPPKITYQATEIRDGTSTTTVTNWRMVRPLEILAMNMPMNGDQEIHHAQKSMVQAVTNSDSTSPWLALTSSMASRFSKKA